MNLFALFAVTATLASAVAPGTLTPLPGPSPENAAPEQREEQVRANATHQPPGLPAWAEKEGFDNLTRAVNRATDTYKRQAEAGKWAWGTIASAVFSFALVVIGGLQVWLVVLQRQTLLAMERPRLIPLVGVPTPVSERQIAFEFRYRLVNYGKSPAWITSRSVKVVPVVDREIPPDEPRSILARLNRDEITVAPGEKWKSYEIEQISDDDKTLMMRGNLEFLLYGMIEYRDVFARKTHHAGFAWFIVRWDGTFKNSRTWSDGAWGVRRGPERYWITD